MSREREGLSDQREGMIHWVSREREEMSDQREGMIHWVSREREGRNEYRDPVTEQRKGVIISR